MIKEQIPISWQMLLDVCPEPPIFTEKQKQMARQRLKELRAQQKHWSQIPEYNMEILTLESVLR